MKKKLIAAPYLVWMVLFIVAPLLIVVYYAFTDSAGHFSIANIPVSYTHLDVYKRQVRRLSDGGYGSHRRTGSRRQTYESGPVL